MKLNMIIICVIFRAILNKMGEVISDSEPSTVSEHVSDSFFTDEDHSTGAAYNESTCNMLTEKN